MERTNKIYVIGNLAQVKDTRSGDKDGISWIAGTAVVTSGSNEFEFKYYASAKTQKGAENSRYTNYIGLSDRIGERVKVNGEINGRVWYNEGQGQVINFNELSAGFFNTPKPTEGDVSTFEFSGFVTKPLYERYNKDEELVAYEMEIAQANYSGNNMQIVRFTVPKENAQIVSAIEKSYAKGTTVAINGEIRYEVTMEEKVEEVAFGDPIVKKYQNTRKSFIITGGKQAIIEEGLAYTPAQIATLQSAYNDYLAQIERDAKERGTISKSAPAAGNNQDRLL
jgi:hypothetical protein